MQWQIFVLGTNNWQGGGEFAPGSGILHEGHHNSLNSLPNVGKRCYSLWPSSSQRSPEDRDDFRVFQLSHQIPICESVSPVSNKRWHSMDEAEFSAYRERLTKEVEEYIAYAEKKHGSPFNLFMAHHCFVNPTVMVEVNRRRVARGVAAVPIVTFAHGTALKMYENEQRKEADYPYRFLPWMREKMKIFESADHIAGVFAIANAQKDTFSRIFPNYPSNRVAVTPNGYNQTIFCPKDGATAATVLAGPKALSQVLYEGVDLTTFPAAVQSALCGSATTPGPIPNIQRYKHFVLFIGKFADWKRLDMVLKAAKQYESSEEVATLIVGGGTNEARQLYVDMAYKELELQHTFFLGPQGQDVLAQLATFVDVGVFPSKDEPFGLVFIECMACGTPVIGAKSGGPTEFVTPEVGTLLEEGPSVDEMAPRLSAVITKALKEDWKKTKGPVALSYAVKNFSLTAQCSKMLAFVEKELLPQVEATPKVENDKAKAKAFDTGRVATLVAVGAVLVGLAYAKFMRNKL